MLKEGVEISGMEGVSAAENKIEQFLKEYLEDSAAEGYVVGVSGGIDSAVTLKLAVKAVGAENLLGLVMPGEPSVENNVRDARKLCEGLNVKYSEIGIEPFVEQFSHTAPFEPGRNAEGNLRVRTRMLLLYLAANEKDLLVLGSSNKTERMLGYFTKHGDGAADVKPIADLYKTEVRELAKELDLPERFVEKEPTAGMWEGQTDEEELGFSYEVIDRVLEPLVEENLSVEEIIEDTGLGKEEVEKIVEMHKESSHKRGPAPYPELR